jgi:hypothetical protein
VPRPKIRISPTRSASSPAGICAALIATVLAVLISPDWV